MLKILATMTLSIMAGWSTRANSEHVVIERLNKSVLGTLSIPVEFKKSDDEVSLRLTLRNVTSKPIQIYDALIPTGCVFGASTSEKKLPIPNMLSVAVPLPDRFKIALEPGHAIVGDVSIRGLWKLSLAQDGEYPVEVIFDDYRYWTDKKKALGKIEFPLRIVVKGNTVSVKKVR